jgi:hypothetical protein
MVSASETQHGPRSDYDLYFYADENAMYSALKAGQIDCMMSELSTAQYADAIIDPNLMLMSVARFDLRGWSLHTNYTTTRIPGWGHIRNPLDQVEFREAVFHCTDKAYYAQVVCGGFAVPLPVPTSANSKGWWNESTVAYAENELNFDLDKARAALTAGGWNDTDHNGIVNFPVGWDGASGQDMLTMRIVKRMDDPRRRDAMTHLISKLAECGIAMQVLEVNSAAEAQPYVMINKDYHMYSSGWSTGRFPTILYGLFYTPWPRPWWGIYTENYHTGVGKDGLPQYPDLDYWLERLFYPTSLEDARFACKNALDLIIRKYKLFIPTWCSRSFYAYRNLLSVTNEMGYGPEYTSTWFPLNGYRADDSGQPIRVGVKNAPGSLNYITANWFWEVATLSRFQDSFFDLTPYNIIVDIPWVAQDFEIGTWVDPDYGTTKRLVKYYLRQGQSWIEPVTGNVLRERNATDHPWTCWYYDATTNAIPYTGYRDIKYLVLPNAYEVDVYFDSYSYWNWLNPFGRDMYPPTWRQEPISHLRTDKWIEGTNMTTNPPYQCLLNAVGNRSEGAPIEIVSIDVDGTPLTLDTTPYLNTHTGQYCLAGTTVGGPKIRIFADFALGQVLTVTYWARGDYSGNTPGNRPWQEMLVGSGPHYLVDLNSTVGGWAKFKANRNHWIETPPSGEIDFGWTYVDGPKPRSIYFMVDILDVVKCTAAYDSTGNGAPGGRPPSGNWEPGADLANPEGLIDIFDVCTITGRYEEKWGES